MEQVIGYYFIEDMGDGSKELRMFNSQVLAEKALARSIENIGYNPNGDVAALRPQDIETSLEEE